MITNFATRFPGALVSPGGRFGRLSILIYHRVLLIRDEFVADSPDVDTFRWQARLLARHFNVLSMPEALQRLAEGTLPARAICITFDDGYADSAEVALPILNEFGLPATFFVASGFLDGGCMWNDVVCACVRDTRLGQVDLSDFGLDPVSLENLTARRSAANIISKHIKHLSLSERQSAVDTLVKKTQVQIPVDLMLSSEQLRKLSQAGMEIGGHTVNHPILRSLPIDDARQEILLGKEQLEKIIQKPVNYFAYPNGEPGMDYETTHIQLIREAGFKGAFSTMRGVATRETDCYQLPRFTPWDNTPPRFLVRLLLNCLNTHPKTA